MSSETIFEFDLRAAAADLESYYRTRWDQAQPITVRAENRQKAMNKAESALGPAPHGRYWTYQFDAIREVVS